MINYKAKYKELTLELEGANKTISTLTMRLNASDFLFNISRGEANLLQADIDSIDDYYEVFLNTINIKLERRLN